MHRRREAASAHLGVLLEYWNLAEVISGGELLFLLTKPNARRVLRESLTVDDSSEYVLRSVLPFFARLGGDDVCRGTCKNDLAKIVTTIYETPGLIAALVGATTTTTTTTTDDAAGAAVSWFVLKLTTQCAEARCDEQVMELAKALVARGAPRAASIATVMSGSGAERGVLAEASLEDVRDFPGGRSTNDHVDFRSISIAPSPDELLLEKGARAPFLPARGAAWLADGVASLLDRQFRLLREDMLGPMRAALRDLGEGLTTRRLSRGSSQQVFGGVLFESIEAKPRPRLMVSFRLPKGHVANGLRREERHEFWGSGAGSKLFPRDSLVALVRAPAGEPVRVEHFAVVASSETSDLARTDVFGRASPRVGLKFSGSGVDDLEVHELAELFKKLGQPDSGLSLVRACPAFFTFAPVLSALQRMEKVPFADELVHGVAEPGAAEYLAHLDLANELADLQRRDGLEYDESQLDALKLALTRRVSLTVGPPGTGKTHLGVRIADVVLRRTDERILVLTYTNHALDDFLGDLVDHGITDIVRIGSNCAPKLAPYSLHAKADAILKEQQSGARRSNFSKARWAQCKQALKVCEARLDNFQAELHAATSDPKEKAETRSTRKKRKRRGSSSAVVSAEALTHEAEGDLEARLSDLREMCALQFVRYDSLTRDLQDLRTSSTWRAALGEARVIGCTTTGAAKNKDLLEDLDIGVLICEEAAEVLEAHTLTSLQQRPTTGTRFSQFSLACLRVVETSLEARKIESILKSHGTRASSRLNCQKSKLDT